MGVRVELGRGPARGRGSLPPRRGRSVGGSHDRRLVDGPDGIEVTDSNGRRVLQTRSESTPFEEAFLSTQYDVQGRPTRVGLELWRGEDAPPTRIAASLLGGAETDGTWAGFLRCRADGVEGLGSYLLWRS